MFGILKDFVKTILMEIFGVKTERVDVSLGTNVGSVEFDFEEASILDETVDVEVEGFHGFEDLEVLCGSLDESSVEVVHESLDSSELEILNPDDEIDPNVLDENLVIHTDFEDKELTFDIPEVSTLNAPYVIIRSELSFEDLWRITLRPKSVVEREKVLTVIENFLKNYRGSVKDLRFMGYFEGVPISGVESITFRGNEMVVKIRPGAVVRERVNVIVFKVDGTVKLEVV